MQIPIQAGEEAIFCIEHGFQYTMILFFLQKLRTIAMQAKRGERYREYLAGKREWDTVYIKPEVPGAWRDPGPNPRDQFGTKFNTD